jgi:hypothetical protein
MELRFVKIAVVYLVLGGGLGVAMGSSGKFQLASVAEWATPLVAGSSMVVMIGLVLFAANVLFNAKRSIP